MFLRWYVWDVWWECHEWKNEDVRGTAGIEMKLTNWVDLRLFRWFGHVKRMDEYRMARRVLMAKQSGVRVQGRSRLGWMDYVKVALDSRGMPVEAVWQCPRDRKECRSLVHISMIEVHPAIIALFLCFFGPPSRTLVAYHLERGAMPLHDAVGVNRDKCATTEYQGQVPKIWAKRCVR